MTHRVLQLRSIFILSVVISGFTSFLHAQTAEELKAEFVDAFLDVDEVRMQQAYDSLCGIENSKPEAFAYELARFYANAAASRPKELADRGPKAEALFREFYTGGKYASMPRMAGWAQLQHAHYMMRTGQADGASILLRGLASNPSGKIFNAAVKQVVNHTILTASDVAFWKSAIEERTANRDNVDPTLSAILTRLQNWDAPDVKRERLAQDAHIYYDMADYALKSGALQKGKDYLKQTKQLLDEFFALIEAGQTTQMTPEELLDLKLSLACAETWLDNDERAGQLVDDIMAEIPTVCPGPGPFQSQAQFWNLKMQERSGEISEESMQMSLNALLNQGHCSVPLACTIVDMLAAYEKSREQMATAYAYYRDLAEDLPNPVLVLWARSKMEKLAAASPELNTLTISPAISTTLFAGANQKIAQDQASRAEPGESGGPRSNPSWRQPLYTGDLSGEMKVKRLPKEEPVQP